MLACAALLLALPTAALRPQTRRAAPTMSATISFSKYQGLGNDFLLVDNRASSTPLATPAQAAKLCDRHFGVGADGLIFVMPGDAPGADYKMTIYNSDGSEPEMCGNGIRCLAAFLGELELSGSPAPAGGDLFNIATGAGPILPVVRPDGLITVDMGEPILDGPAVPCALAPTDGARVVDAPLEAAGQALKVTAVSMGNPHSVAFVPDAKAVDLPVVGRAVEVADAWPEKVNAEFVDVVDRTHVNMVVWERGCGITLACGTGACAVGVAGVLTGRTERTVEVTLPGGPLEIEWRESDNHVYMTGPAEFVFSGTVALPSA